MSELKAAPAPDFQSQLVAALQGLQDEVRQQRSLCERLDQRLGAVEEQLSSQQQRQQSSFVLPQYRDDSASGVFGQNAALVKKQSSGSFFPTPLAKKKRRYRTGLELEAVGGGQRSRPSSPVPTSAQRVGATTSPLPGSGNPMPASSVFSAADQNSFEKRADLNDSPRHRDVVEGASLLVACGQHSMPLDDVHGTPPSEPAATPHVLLPEDNTSIRNSLTRMRAGLPINIESTWVTVLDIFYLFSGVAMVSVTIALWHEGAEDDQRSRPPVWLMVFVALVEIFTALWMGVHSFVRVRRGEWDMLNSVPLIRKQYFRSTWFWIDVFTALPIEFIMLLVTYKAFYGVMYRHLLRYFRGLSLGASVNPLLSGRRKGFSFVSYCCTLMISTHIIACIFWAMADEHCDSYITALYWATATLTGTGYGDIVAKGEDQRFYAVICMIAGIITVATFTAFATKFVTFKNPIDEQSAMKKETMHNMLRYYEVPWETQLQVMSCFSSVINKNDERQFKLLTEDLPPALQEHLGHYFNLHLLRQAPFFDRVFSSLRSGVGALTSQQNDLEKHYLVELASRMHRVCYPAFQTIFTQGEEGDEMFIVISGVVEISVTVETTETVPQSPTKSRKKKRESVNVFAKMNREEGGQQDEDQQEEMGANPTSVLEEVVVSVLKPYQSFGEGPLIALANETNHAGSGDIPSGVVTPIRCIRSGTAQTRTMCELIVLSAQDFQETFSRTDDGEARATPRSKARVSSRISNRKSTVGPRMDQQVLAALKKEAQAREARTKALFASL